MKSIQKSGEKDWKANAWLLERKFKKDFSPDPRLEKELVYDFPPFGFNIDAIGLSFGGENKGTYINGSQVQNAISNPTTFNALLIGDHDRGSLNSEFYGKYRLNDRWSVKAGLQHLFTEYTTVTKVQQFPEPNDRFRNKSTLFMIGVSMALK